MSYNVFYFVFILGLYVMFFYHFHYMVILIGLEMVLLSVFVFLGNSLAGGLVSWSCFVFLLVVVCMGGYGVSLLVSMARGVGRDFWSVGSLS